LALTKASAMRAGEAAPVAFFVIPRELGPWQNPPLDRASRAGDQEAASGYGIGVGGAISPSAAAIAV
jgi:hypothetical protein